MISFIVLFIANTTPLAASQSVLDVCGCDDGKVFFGDGYVV